MIVSIPVWLVVAVIGFAPFAVGALVYRAFENDGGIFDGMLAGFAFAVSAAACWTGLAVWALTRWFLVPVDAL